MDLIIGQVYKVSCAQLRWNDGRRYNVPIIDHFHSDPQFGFEQAHYHIDARFEIEPRLLHHFSLVDGRTSAVIVEQCSSYQLEGVVEFNLICVGLTTGLQLPESGDNADLYANWYAGYVGMICAGRRCPHFGTTMVVENKKLVCPMHHLSADTVSLKVLPLDCL